MTKARLTLTRTTGDRWHPFDALVRRRGDGFNVWFNDLPTRGAHWSFTHYDKDDTPTQYRTRTVHRITETESGVRITTREAVYWLRVSES